MRASSGGTGTLARGIRRSAPGVWTPYSEGGIGIIPRRSLANPGFLRTGLQLASLASSSPLRLLTQIIDSDVDCSLAADNIISLTTGDVDIVAEPVGVDNASPDPTGTALLHEFLEGLPNEIGGLTGLQSIGTLCVCTTGMTALEAVPGEPLSGLSRLWPVDPLTVLLTRDDPNDDARALQRQSNLTDTTKYDALHPGYVALDPATFFWKPYQPFVDDPYGRANFGAALAEILSMLHVLQALRDCVDHTAWPRGVVQIDTTALYEIAQRLGYEDTEHNPRATQYVQEQFALIAALVQELKADDWVVLGGNSETMMMQGGTFAGLEAIMNELRSRIVRGLKQLPVMMAFQQGATEGHTSVQWQVYARRLEAIRSAVLSPILKALTLHFRLRGERWKAVAKYQPIRTTDAQVEAQTESLQIKNAAQKYLLGIISDQQMSLALSGTGMVGPMDRNALLLIATGSHPAGVPMGTGSTQEEQSTQDTLNGANAK